MSSTIHALRASARRNSSHSITALPLFVSTVLNNFTPSTSTLAKPAMLSDSTNARGRVIKHSSPTTKGTQRMVVSSIVSPLQFVQLAHVHRSKRLSDAEDKDAEDHHRDDHIEENADFDHERHSVGRQRNRGEHDAVFHREERQHLSDGFATVDHQEKTGQQESDGDGERVVAEPFERRDWAGNDIREHGQCAADEHRGGHVHKGVDFLFDFDLAHKAFESPREKEHFANDREDRDHVNVPGVIGVTDDTGDGGEQEGLQGENADVRDEHRLYGQEELQHQHQRGEQREDLRSGFGGGRVHGYRNRKVDTSASVARMNAALNRSGTRNRRSFALVNSTSTTALARTSSFTTKNSRPKPKAAGVVSAASPTGKKMFASSAIRTSCLMEAPHSMSAR